jgi:hypothetical protein
LSAFVIAAVLSAWTQTTPVKIGQLDLTIGGISATVTPAQPVIPKDISSGVQIVVTLNGKTLTPSAVAQYLGGPFQIQGEYSGPGLSQTVDVPQSPAENSLVLDLPAVDEAGNYTLSNLRFMVNGKDVFDLSPNSVVVDVIDQVLVTSVQTQELTLDQIQAAGVVLDSSDYTGFQFTIGLLLSSQVVNISFPVVFDSQGVPIPQPISPPATPTAPGVSVPVTIVPVLLQCAASDCNGGGAGGGTPQLPGGGGSIRIPSILVIPGNVGYLKQFFSAQLYVTNDTPAEANLVVDNLSGTINLPPGKDGVVGTDDDPLGLPTLKTGPEAITMPILLNGASTLNAGQTGQAAWTVVANAEGFYPINFAINATLEGLPTGPVNLIGSASGGVLVRNPYFNMTFTVPGVVRKGENFNVYATVTNTSQAPANDLTVTIDAAKLSGAKLAGNPPPPISTLNAGDSTTLTYTFQALTTGKVVADYLKFDTENGTNGTLNFTLGVYANGTAMSPDTIVLPSSVDNLPSDVVNAAMRVLGQAWSVATAPTLPAGVIPTSTTVVTQKALALAEAGLRQTLGESLDNAVRDLVPDFWGGTPVDPGFNQVLQTTPAGQAFIAALGAYLAQPMQSLGGPLPYESQLTELEASGPNFLAFAVGNGNNGNGASLLPVIVSLTDSLGNQLSTNTPGGSIPGGVLLTLSSNSTNPVLGLVTAPTAPPYTLLLTPQGSGTAVLSIAIPHGDGTVIRGQVVVEAILGHPMRIVADFTNPNNLVLQVDTRGDGSFATNIPLSTQIISPSGPNLTSATVIGPGTVSQAGPFGLNMVMLFDRIVDAATSAVITNYTIPNNTVHSASRQLSGRLVFGNLTQPEGPYIPTKVAVSGIADQRGIVGPSSNVTLQSTLQDPGAVVSGHVLNANGTISTTATVTYLNASYLPGDCYNRNQQGLAATSVNGSGLYQFRYVRQDDCGGPFAVATNDPNNGELRKVSTYVRGRGQQIVLDLAMLGVGSVTGQVKFADGRPASDAQVVAISAADIQGGGYTQVGGQAYTDANGYYTISGITVGPVTVKAGSGIFLGSNAGNIVGAGTTAVVNITLSGSVNVSGVVTQVQTGSTTSVPVPNLPVVYYQNGLAKGYAMTGSDGSYVLTDMPAGAYTISATMGVAGEIDTPDTGTAVAGSNIVANLTIVIPTTVVVNGVVKLPNGFPAGGAIVYQGQFGVLSNQNDGTFALGGVPVLPSQSQTIHAITPDGLRTGQATVVVNSATIPPPPVKITLSGLGSAQFTVKDANGNPLANQPVKIGPGSGPGCSDTCGCNVQKTNASGVVTFTGLPVGGISGSALNNSGDFAKAAANITQDGITGYGLIQFNGTGKVTGSVVDPTTNHNPVLGATVQLSSYAFHPDDCALEPTNSQSLQTDVTGKFQFNSVLVGPVSATASQAFYPTPVGAQGTLTKNGGTVNFNLQMVDTISGVLSGVVFMPDGVTPAGAGVQVTANGPLPNVTVSTDATGTYKFAKIFPQGMYTLSAADPTSGGVMQMNIYLIAGQDTAQNLRLLGTGTVNVTVVDGANTPVDAAYITLNENGYPNAVFNGSLDASNLGVISFPDIFEGNFSVQVVDPYGRGGRASGVLPQGANSVNLQVQLTTTGTVQGHFYLPDGVTPIPNAIVNLTASGRVIGQAVTQSIGDVGSYSFDYVPAGSVLLNAQDPSSGRTGIAAGSIPNQEQSLVQPLILDIIAEGLDTVKGQVTSDGSPMPGANVTITSGRFQATTNADSNGNYLMDGVPEGVVVATASLNTGANNNISLTGTASIPVSGDSKTFTLDVHLRDSGSVTGQVWQADRKNPATTSVVTITVGGTGGGTQSTTTDAQGNFSFTMVPAGTATISVQVLGSIDQGAMTVVVPVGSNVTTPIYLNGIGSVSGVAEDSAGQPTPGTIVLTGTGTFPYYLTATAAADGTFALPQVLAGPFTARLTANIGGFTLYGTKSGTVSPDKNYTLPIQLQPSGTITGIILRPDGTSPAVGANIVIQSLVTYGTSTLQAQNDGSFTAAGVPQGPFTVQINDPISGGIAAILGQSIVNDNDTVNLGTITLDGNALSIVSSNPIDQAIGVPINQPLTVTFSESLASTNGINVTNGTSNIYFNPSLSSDGKTVTLQPQGTWPDGNTLALNVTGQVTDVFGRQLLTPRTIAFTTVDLTPPSVLTISPAYRAIQVPVDANVVVIFNKALSTTAALGSVITLSAGGSPVAGNTSLTAPSTLTFTPSAPLMNNTIYNITVNGAVSFGGNIQTTESTSYFVSPETTAPVLQLNSPLNGSYVNTTTPTISISVSDPLTGINPYSESMVLDGGQPFTPNIGSTMTFTPATSLASGPHTISASVQNNAGIAGVLSASFIVDTAPPSVAILTGIDAGQKLKGQIAISASASDTISGIANINLIVDGVVRASLTGPSFSATFDTTQLPDGPHNFAAQAVNNAGSSGPASTAIQAFVENITLSVYISSPLSGAPYKGQVVVTATASEPVQNITFSLGTQTVTATASPYQGTLSLSGVPDGPQTITATAYDFVGDSASSTVTITVKQTPPAAPNANLIFAEPPNNGVSLVHGSPGAVSAGGLVISVTDTSSQATATSTSASDGSFATNIAAAVNDTLLLTATDVVGNVSAPTLIAVRQTASLPPSTGNTSLVYEGDMVDRVGGGSNGLSPDGQLDAVFVMNMNIGEGLTRTISYITLVGPQTISTQTSNLGVAADVGSTLLNGTNGQINFPVSTGATVTLFATDSGLIQPGATYTATAVFTDGSHFVATYTYVAPADRQYVAHSATITANPSTVVVNGSTPGTSIITITNIRDINGTVVPDGANIALSATNMATVNPAGTPVPSAGGAFIDGTTAANNPNFQVYTIQNGTVTATYSTQSVTPTPISGALAVIQMQATDANGNVLGTRIVSSQDINIRASTDTAIVSVSPGSLYADRGDHRSHVTVVLRDANGNVLPDGTQAAITVQNWNSIVGGSWITSSAGGTLLNIPAYPNYSSYALGTMSDSQISFDYSDSSIFQAVNNTSPAIIQVLPLNSNGNFISNYAIGTANITLVGAAIGDIDPSQPSVPQVSPAVPLQVQIQDVHDTRGNLVPDGANIGITASSGESVYGGSWIYGVGGTIFGGTPDPSDSNWHYFPLVSNGFISLYSTDGSTIVSPGQTGIAPLQLQMLDPNAQFLDYHAITVHNLVLVPPSNAVGSSQPASILGDGGIHTSTVVFKPVLDAYGNTVPDGTVLAVGAAASDASIPGIGWIQSAGGQIVSGTPSATPYDYKIHTVQNGALTVTYADQNVIATPGQTLTANVVVVEANTSGQIPNYGAVGVVPVTISGITSAQGAANPTAVFANGGDYRSNITISNFRDAVGNPVPDGTQVAVTAAAYCSIISGSGWVQSAGGVIFGGTPASFGSQYSIFTITNGQVVLQYSSQGVSVASGTQTATIQVIPVKPDGNMISYIALATVSVQLLSEGSASVSVSPVDLTANGLSNQSAITISGLKESDGVTPVPDGALVGLTATPYEAIVSGLGWVAGAGGTISSAGTSPGDGTLATNNSYFQQFTVAGGQVSASYSDLGITAGIGQTVQAYIAVVPLSNAGAVLTTYPNAIGVGTVNLHGVTSTTAIGPATMSLSANSTASVTFSGIKDSAGNMVPDGTTVAVTVGSYITIVSGVGWVTSTGGTIVNGTPSPQNSNYNIFTTLNGSVTVTYSTAGASVGTASVQIVPATPNGNIIGGTYPNVLNGGDWAINITN